MNGMKLDDNERKGAAVVAWRGGVNAGCNAGCSRTGGAERPQRADQEAAAGAPCAAPAPESDRPPATPLLCGGRCGGRGQGPLVAIVHARRRRAARRAGDGFTQQAAVYARYFSNLLIGSCEYQDYSGS